LVDTFFSALLDPSPDVGDYDPTNAQQLDAERHASFARLLGIVAWCWIAYVLILYLLDYVLVARAPQLQLLPPLYYLLHASDALIVLVIATLQQPRRGLGRAFLPVVIICLSVVPLLITVLVAPLAAGPITGIPGFLILRFGPVELIGAVLLAWNYSWKSVVRCNLVLLVLIIAPAVLLPQIATATVVVAVLQTVGFLILSYCVHVLVERLRRQAAALRHANRQLRQYAGTLEHLTISRERNRVARELHDTLAHTLSSLSVQLETVKAYWPIEPQTAQALLESALVATRSGLQETRRALDALRARPLDDVGLRIALCDMVEAAAELANLELDLALPDDLPLLEATTEQAIYRIIQEAVANVCHHAEARHLRVIITCTRAQFVLRVQDDGRGFDYQNSRQPGHFGLAGMAERAALIGGQLEITSMPGTGTQVELKLAFDEKGVACAC
jgi:signal transduction histidine kinase